jgi:hypothetical protein
MTARSCVVSFLILLLTAATAGAQGVPGPMEINVSTACEGDAFVLRVSVLNIDPDVGSMSVTRVTTAPDMLPELLLTADPVALPWNEITEVSLPDPGVGPGDLGIYEIELFWNDGSSYYVYQATRSCVDEPFLMRGYLLDTTEFLPCTDQGLLECDIVSLLYGDMNAYVGSNELLEIYGWPISLDARDNCAVTVYSIASLGTQTGCDDVVPAATVSWGAAKARYR